MAEEQFYTILTNVGKAKIANATLLNSNLTLKTLKVGDGNGTYYNPTEDQEDLKNTVHECAIGAIYIDKKNPNWIISETIIPGSVGGFTIREVGLFDAEGDMIAVGKYPETYKPVVANGASKDLNVRTIFEVSNAENVTLNLDPSVIIATKEDINNLQEQIDENTAQLKDLANPNLFINGDFRNPVNTKGKTIYNRANLDNIDMWNFYSEKIENDVTLKLVDGGITIQNSTSTSQGGIFQNINCVIEDGSTLTFSAYVDGEVRTLTGVYGSTPIVEVKDGFKIGFAKINNVLQGVLYSWDDKLHTIKWVKLELGDKSTPLYPKTYVEELQNCLMYNGNELTTPYSNPNLLINGDFQVWQRGTSFSTNGYTADRWIYDVEGDDKGKIVRHANGGVQIKLISNKRFWFMQRIELNQELKNIFSNSTVTLSFYVTTSAGVKISPYIRVWSPSRNANIFLKSYEAKATRQLIECQITLGDLSSDDWLGIDIFRIEEDNKFTVGDDLYIRFENSKLELGTKATPFIPRLYGEELALCKRYYEPLLHYKTFGVAITDPTDGTILSCSLEYSPKRITPSITFGAQDAFGIPVSSGAIASKSIAVLESNIDRAQLQVRLNGSTTPGQAFLLQRNDSSNDSSVYVDAEIY